MVFGEKWLCHHIWSSKHLSLLYFASNCSNAFFQSSLSAYFFSFLSPQSLWSLRETSSCSMCLGRPPLITFMLQLLFQKGNTALVLNLLCLLGHCQLHHHPPPCTGSCMVQSIHFWVHRWMSLLGVLVCCTEILSLVTDVQLIINWRGEKKGMIHITMMLTSILSHCDFSLHFFSE